MALLWARKLLARLWRTGQGRWKMRAIVGVAKAESSCTRGLREDNARQFLS